MPTNSTFANIRETQFGEIRVECSREFFNEFMTCQEIVDKYIQLARAGEITQQVLMEFNTFYSLTSMVEIYINSAAKAQKDKWGANKEMNWEQSLVEYAKKETANALESGKLIAALNDLVSRNFQNIMITILGVCIYVTGETYSIRTVLKEMGYHYRGDKDDKSRWAWFPRFYHNRATSFADLQQRFAGTAVNTNTTYQKKAREMSTNGQFENAPNRQADNFDIELSA